VKATHGPAEKCPLAPAISRRERENRCRSAKVCQPCRVGSWSQCALKTSRLPMNHRVVLVQVVVIEIDLAPAD